jgi:hypothetical protein
MKPLYKTVIVIWSGTDPADRYELSDLAYEATEGCMYCSKMKSTRVEHPEEDKDWDDTEFFGDENGDEDGDEN